jgi:hypothetical protein
VQSDEKLPLRRALWRVHHDRLAAGGALEPSENPIGISNRRGEPNPLDVVPAHRGKSFENGHEVRAAVRAGERMHLVDDHEAEVAEESRRGRA